MSGPGHPYTEGWSAFAEHESYESVDKHEQTLVEPFTLLCL